MGRYICKRILGRGRVLFGVSILKFALINLVPGDAVDGFLRVSEIYPTPEVIAETRSEMGLDKPLYAQYADWLGKATHLDFGKSYINKKPVLDELLYYFPATMELTTAAMIIMVALSLPIGIFFRAI